MLNQICEHEAKLLLIGPCAPPVGGVTVLFDLLVEGVKSYPEIKTKVINTSGSPGKSAFNKSTRFLGVIIKILLSKDITVMSIHSTSSTARWLGPFVSIIAKLRGIPLVYRQFGGCFHEYFQSWSPMVRAILTRTILDSEICLYETQAMVDYFRQHNSCKKVEWYPNYRSRVEGRPRALSSGATKCVFLGHVKRTKGVLDIVHAVNGIKNIHVDIYGPITDDITREDLNRENVAYRGAVDPTQVMDVLEQYDVLLLPTFHVGEGYPGVILEAFSMGIPVITTRWRSIPEIVDSSCGILIEPNDINGLSAAINKIKDAEVYSQLSIGALRQASKFESAYWVEQFIEHIRSVVQ